MELGSPSADCLVLGSAVRATIIGQDSTTRQLFADSYVLPHMPLTRAVKKQFSSKIIEKLVAEKNTSDEDKQAALMLAVNNNNISQVRALTDGGIVRGEQALQATYRAITLGDPLLVCQLIYHVIFDADHKCKINDLLRKSSYPKDLLFKTNDNVPSLLNETSKPFF